MNALTKSRDEISIIVVDDMKFNCEFVRKGLQSEGYSDVRVALTAREALQQLEERPAEVLLADWTMPEMDGLELTDRIRQIDEEKNRYTGVLLLTGRDDIASVIKAFERGVDDYITKPPNKQELAARIYAAGRVASLQNGQLETMVALRASYKSRVTIDQLTGMGNRLDAERRLEELLEMVDSRGGAVCCGIFNLNESDKLRAEYGEAAYREILKSIATRLRRSVRPIDVVARVSDSRFVIGMYYQDEEQIRGKSYKRLLQAINLRPVKTLRGFITISGTMSVSCSHRDMLHESAQQLMEAAARKVNQPS
jgi:diguanylate cyclase (GGDEF)-like protein